MLLLLLLLLAAGCGGGESASSPGGPTTALGASILGPRACDLLEPNDVRDALGFTPVRWETTAPNPLGSGTFDTCYFGRESGVLFGPILQVSTFPPGSSFGQASASLRNVSPVDGVGRRAFIATTPGRTTDDLDTIGVDTSYGIFGVSARVDAKLSREQLIDLAQRAGARYDARSPR